MRVSYVPHESLREGARDGEECRQWEARTVIEAL